MLFSITLFCDRGHGKPGYCAGRRAEGIGEPVARWAAPGDRATTEALLQRAALELLEANGVLDGLNLREEADRACVNRGLVYHYCGSRRELLRSALLADAEARIADFR